MSATRHRKVRPHPVSELSTEKVLPHPTKPEKQIFLPHTAKKATYAIEPCSDEHRPSRKSTRGGANRIKPDSSFNLREQLVKGSPEARSRRSQAQALRVRGGGF
jgi:hypothetical protein